MVRQQQEPVILAREPKGPVGVWSGAKDQGLATEPVILAREPKGPVGVWSGAKDQGLATTECPTVECEGRRSQVSPRVIQ